MDPFPVPSCDAWNVAAGCWHSRNRRQCCRAQSNSAGLEIHGAGGNARSAGRDHGGGELQGVVDRRASRAQRQGDITALAAVFHCVTRLLASTDPRPVTASYPLPAE